MMKKYWKRHPWLVLLFTLFAFVAEGLIIGIANLNGMLIDAVIAGSNNIPILFIAIALFSLAMPISFYLYTLLIQLFRVRVQAAMRGELFSGILRRSYREYLKRDEGTYIAAYTSQISGLDNSYFRVIFGMLQIIASSVIALVFLYLIHPPFILYSIAGIIPAIAVPKLFESRISKLQEEKIAIVSRNIATLNEYLAGIGTIIMFRRQRAFAERFGEQTESISIVSAKIPDLMNLTTNLSHLLLQLYSIAIILVSTLEIASGNLSIGSYIAAIHILSDFTGGLSFTTHYLQQYAVSRQTIRHIQEVSGAEFASAPDAQTTPAEARIRKVERIDFTEVSFSYDGENDIIRDFSYSFQRPGIYQIAGASGSGKSTLMSLLCGYLEPRSGTAGINRTPIPSISNLSDLFTIMRQEAIFFDGSLKDNITMFADIPDHRVLSELDRLGLSALAAKLEDTAFSLSGGEQRRIMLLRALLRDTDILILDEPLANLDRESVSLVERRLQEIDDRFVLIITHEPLSIPVVDTITKE